MAHILPETPPQKLPAEVSRVFRVFKNLPDNFYVWHHLAPWQADAPDFLVITFEGHALLVKISTVSPNQAPPAAQMLLLGELSPIIGANENSVLMNFIEKLHITTNHQLETMVLFPNLTQRQVDAGRLERKPGEPCWAGRDLLQNDDPQAWTPYFPSQPLNAEDLERIRQQFTPEVLVPEEMTVRLKNPRRVEAGLTSYLLDYNQEAAVKADLDLEPEGETLGSNFRLNIINGVAGSGKTLILIYRLRLLQQLYPKKRFLVLTHNRPLCHDMESRFVRISGTQPETIEWRTFNAWCYQHWPAKQRWIDPISTNKRQRLVRNIWEKHLQSSGITENMFLSEIDWWKDQLPLAKAGYLEAKRKGRGFRLTTDKRQRVFQAIEAYEQALINQKSLDWGDVPRKIWQFLEDGIMKPEPYDVIMVDEAQFFAPIWVEIIQRILTPNNPHLFMVADPTQGFLGRGGSWKSLGLDARGRSHQLRRCYRSTREILQFAILFYRMRLGEEHEEEDILAPDLINMPAGVIPQIIPLDSHQDEISRVSNEVTEFIRSGMPKKHILLLHANSRGAESLVQSINQRVGPNTALDAKKTYPGDYVRVTTLNAGAGLESPIVFLVGLRELFEEEQSVRLSDEDREALIRSNTRKIYMAATRAGQRLVFTYVGDLPEILKNSLKS
jgi:hypothetical protein